MLRASPSTRRQVTLWRMRAQHRDVALQADVLQDEGITEEASPHLV
jgi:hypothetical protein